MKAFPDQYIIYVSNKGKYYLDGLLQALEQIKQSWINSTQDSEKLGKDRLFPGECNVLICLFEAIIKKRLHINSKKTWLKIKMNYLKQSIELIRFAQCYAIDFLKLLYEDLAKTQIISHQEWKMISNQVAALREDWIELHQGHFDLNWIDFFEKTSAKILHYGTVEILFELITYLSEQGSKLLRILYI